MRPNHALALSIALLGGIDTYLTATIMPMPVWVTFIGWASFFACGGGVAGLVRSVLCNWTGVAIVTVVLFAIAGFGPHNPAIAALCVGLGSGAMILASAWRPVSFPPSIVFGFACTVGTVAALGRPISTAGAGNPALVVASAMAVGALYGIVSERLAQMLSAHPASAATLPAR